MKMKHFRTKKMQENFENLLYVFRSKLLKIVSETPKTVFQQKIVHALVKVFGSRKRRNHRSIHKQTQNKFRHCKLGIFENFNVVDS